MNFEFNLGWFINDDPGVIAGQLNDGLNQIGAGVQVIQASKTSSIFSDYTFTVNGNLDSSVIAEALGTILQAIGYDPSYNSVWW
jgi:hypothetical protein